MPILSRSRRITSIARLGADFAAWIGRRTRSSSTADIIRLLGRAAYGADRACYSLILKGLVAVRYRPRAINNMHSLSYRGGVPQDADVSTEPRGDGVASTIGTMSAFNICFSHNYFGISWNLISIVWPNFQASASLIGLLTGTVVDSEKCAGVVLRWRLRGYASSRALNYYRSRT
jgi:hypothetical protein